MVSKCRGYGGDVDGGHVRLIQGVGGAWGHVCRPGQNVCDSVAFTRYEATIIGPLGDFEYVLLSIDVMFIGVV